jgi:hypothetical protein
MIMDDSGGLIGVLIPFLVIAIAAVLLMLRG